MDSDEIGTLLSLLKDDIPESLQNRPEVHRYLSELSGFSVDGLAREPQRLASELKSVQEQTRELAFHNYSTFIHTAKASHDIFQDFQHIESRAEGMQEKLSDFSDCCKNFLKHAQDISTSRKRNTWTLQRHPQLLELLEVAQLMTTCVRGGCYDEALELAAHVRRLEKRHGNIPVIASLVKEVQQSHELMLGALLQELHTGLQLPACLRVVGLLRRMEAFTESQLRLKFLQARDHWLQGLLSTIPSHDAYTHISKVIETCRVHLFDIMTQYRAIFSDDEAFYSPNREPGVHEPAIFQGWINIKVSEFLATLRADLALGVSGRLDGVLARCMYFGLSFSRVGVDFRGLLPPIFEEAALNTFTAALQTARTDLESCMKTYVPHVSGAAYSSILASQNSELNPPGSLLDLAPLAQLSNALASAFNTMRLCAPLSLAAPTAREMQQVFFAVSEALARFHRSNSTSWSKDEQEAFTKLLLCYSGELLPYMQRIHMTMFPPAQLASAAGLPPLTAQTEAAKWTFDITECLKPIEALIPERQTSEPEVESNAPSTLNQPAETVAGADEKQENGAKKDEAQSEVKEGWDGKAMFYVDQGDDSKSEKGGSVVEEDVLSEGTKDPVSEAGTGEAVEEGSGNTGGLSLKDLVDHSVAEKVEKKD